MWNWLLVKILVHQNDAHLQLSHIVLGSEGQG
jgi:hypothetical protein